MPATIRGTEGLQFGTPTVPSVILTSLEAETNAETAFAVDEDGDTVGFVIYGGDRAEVSGEYFFKGSDIASIGGAIAGISGLQVTGTVYCTSISRRHSNTGFTTGRFRGIAVNGI